MTRISESTGEPFDTRLGAYCLVERDGKFLLALWDMRHRDPNFQPRWTLPGGGIDLGEDLRAGVRREVQEETGYLVDSLRLLDAQTGVIAGRHRYAEVDHAMQTVAIVYTGRVVGGELAHEQQGSTSRAAWFTREEIAQLPRVERVDRALALYDGAA
ncbi:NUDIX hydrolase [Glutamicibacter sp. X7]